MFESTQRHGWAVFLIASALVLSGAQSQTPIVDSDFDGYLLGEEWTPTSAVAEIRPLDGGSFDVRVTMQDSALDCSELDTSAGTRLTLDHITWRSLGRYAVSDAAVEASRIRNGVRTAQPFVEGSFRLRTRTRNPPEGGQTFVLELDLDDVPTNGNYAQGLVTVRVCP